MADYGLCSTCAKDQFRKPCADCWNIKLKEINDHISQTKTVADKIQKEMTVSLNVLCEKVDNMKQDIGNMLHEVITQITVPLKDRKFNILEDTDHEHDDLVVADGQPTELIWKVTNFKQKLKRLKDLEDRYIQSDAFYTKDQGLKVKVKLGFDHSKNSIDIFLEWNPASPPYWHARQFAMLDQSDSTDKKHVSIIDTPLFSKNPTMLMMKPSFVDHTLFPIDLLEKEYPYMSDDSILIKVNITPLSLMYKTVASNDGILLWRIESHATKKRDEIQNIQRFLNSDPFYTHPQGYRVLAHLHLDGHQSGKGNSITIYVGFIIGEFDQALRFPFHCQVKLCLLDQSETLEKQHFSSQFAFTCQEGHTYMGQHFVLQSMAEQPPYLMDDSLLFKIMVETS